MNADEIIEAVEDALIWNEGVDIIHIHDRKGHPFAAIVKEGTPAYESIKYAYPSLPLPPHSHIEPGMF